MTILDQFTEDAPARLRASVTNTAGEQRDFAFEAVVPVDDRWGEHTRGNAKLALFPEDRLEGTKTELDFIDTNEDGEFEPVPETPEDGCWQPADEFAYAGTQQYLSLEACERVSRTYLVFAHPENDPCLPAGAYRFETLWKPREYGESLTWEFDIHVSE